VEVQQEIINKKMKFYVVDGYRVAQDAQMGVRIIQSCRRASSN